MRSNACAYLKTVFSRAFRTGPAHPAIQSLNEKYYSGGGTGCFGCGPDNAGGLNMHVYRTQKEWTPSVDPTDGGVPDVLTLWRPQPGLHQGYNGILHGGVVSALVDCLACWAVTNRVHLQSEIELAAGTLMPGSMPPAGNNTLTMSLGLNYRKPTIMSKKKIMEPCAEGTSCGGHDHGVNGTHTKGLTKHANGLTEVRHHHEDENDDDDPPWVRFLPSSTLLLTSSVVPSASKGRAFTVVSKVHDLYRLGESGALALRQAADLQAVSVPDPLVAFSMRQFSRDDFDAVLLQAMTTLPERFFGDQSALGLGEALETAVTVTSEGSFYNKGAAATIAARAREDVLGASTALPEKRSQGTASPKPPKQQQPEMGAR